MMLFIISGCLLDGTETGTESGSTVVSDPNPPENPTDPVRNICDPFQTNSPQARDRGLVGNLLYLTDDQPRYNNITDIINNAAPISTEFNTNSYWIGATNEFTYLSGPTASLKFYRATVDASMNLIAGPTQIPVVGTIPVPIDPAPHGATNKIVYPGMYNPGGGFVKSIFIMNLSDSTSLVGLSLGRDRTGATIICNSDCSNIDENDPKISPDGTKVAFMRRAKDSGANGFGFHIFVVPVASPLSEVDISYSTIGADISKNEVLPEWINNDTLVFSTIDIITSTNYTKEVYTMKSDGTLRTKIPLPSGFKYSDVFPFVDGTGKQRLVISAEKIGATCL
ncbi:MAG: hypothetical protein ABL930_00535 [Pseudobdellovibrio sp.]